jgi:hypothetical protein
MKSKEFSTLEPFEDPDGELYLFSRLVAKGITRGSA